MGQRTHKGRLYIVSAPSGTGKTTLCTSLLERVPNLRESVSFTTRKPRAGETQDVDYTFISVEEFKLMLSAGQFIEWAEVFGNYYGTSLKRIEEILASGGDVLLDIDIQGVRQIKAKHTDAVFIFILPPSMEILENRLRGRGKDSEEDILKRLKIAKKEIRECVFYDYVIVNDIFDMALNQLQSVIISNRLRADGLDYQWLEKHFDIH
ncbi:guanylate kinase [Candidatus Magnetomonas plexicatena]|uniref:guanylate kinase n=1 Tax=Candidatus Magnetomonas plexicatena TaxID=2552947 RepID=UPI001C761744|nr:guanylate kinase [Nitrospirales bacterium LBB_01]